MQSSLPIVKATNDLYQSIDFFPFLLIFFPSKTVVLHAIEG